MWREIKFRGWDGEEKRMWSWHELQHTHFMASLYSHGDGSWEVMQYTGLRDKNGTEIYEGDIVLVDNGRYQGEVRWNDQDLSFVIENHDGGFGFVNGQIFDERPEYRTYEVIGNIYENADLLSGESDEH